MVKRPTAPASTNARWLPELVFYPVNPSVLARFAIFAGVVTAVSGIARFAAALAEKKETAPALGWAGDVLAPANPMLASALLFGALGLALVFAVRIGLLDRQVTFSLAKAVLTVALIYVFCGVVALLRADMAWWPKAALLFLLLLGTTGQAIGGNLRYYMSRKYYGDAVVEAIVLCLMAYLAMRPVHMLLWPT